MSSQNSAEKDVESTWGTLDESVKRTVIAMRDYAQQKETDFQTVVSLCSSDLGVFLKDFYLTLKDNNECDGSTSSHLQRVRSELAEYFKKVSNVDIINGADFAEGNALIDGPSTPRDIDTKLPVMKKHNRQRTFTFETNELRQIYMSDAMNLDQPETLQNKVFFDVCMYICNRGKDFLRLMTKSDLEISSDENGRRYVWLKYDTKFSFNEVAGGMTCEGTPGQQIGDRMYARPGDPKCPVLSYTKYAIHLHPMSDAFWQRPKRSVMPTDFVWFDNVCIGNSTLNKLMNRITQSAGLPDSYAINAIKPSYIPIIESICRSALFGSQQFRRILQMKHANHDSHQVRKRHSEGSLTIANTLQESPMFRPRHSESQLPVYKTPSTDGELMRSNSASPILRGGAWETGPPAMFMKAMKAMPDHRRNSPDGSSYHKGYRNSEPDFARYTYGLGYRNGEHESPQEQRGGEPSQSGGGNGYHYGDDDKKKIETGSILQAKHKCLDIVHSLEVRDIKSFINWMKTFEVKHGPGGLMVTCQPVNAAEMECQSNRVSEQNGIGPYLDSPKKEAGNYSKYEGCQWRRDSLTNARDKQEFLPLRPEFENVKGTYCSATELSPLKITVPMQDTLLLTGLKANAQVLIHDAKEEGKYAPLQTRIFRSSHQYDLDQIETVALHEASAHGSKYETGDQYDSSRSNCYKEEKSIPVKKRLVVDQSDHSVPQSSTQSMSPPNMYPHPHSPPNFNKYSSQQRYAVQAPLIFSHSSAPTPSVPKYRERFPDGWGYIPLQKRQKFGIQMRPEKDDVPLDLIKQN